MGMDWVAILFLYLGFYLGGRQHPLCWPCWIAGDIFYVLHWWPKEEQATLVATVGFILLHVKGWYDWTLNKEELQGQD